MSSTPRWYRSLYWRIGLGLFAFLALMLAAQGSLFLWMTDPIAGSMPAPNPRRLAVLVASDVGAALSEDASLDLEAYVQEQYQQVLQTFVVIMRDGRVLSNHDDVPVDLVEAVRTEQEAMNLRGLRFGRWRESFGGQGDEAPRQSPEADRPFPDPARAAAGAALRQGRRRGEFAQVMVDGAPAGRVVVLPGGPSFSRVLRRFGPPVALVATGVLGVGMTLIALVVFGPARRRLAEVQTATEALGSGRLDVRVPEHGGDEVAVLARSFNRMAGELTERAEALATSDAARRQLLADVSHELMTPLTAIRGYIETLSMTELQLDPDTRARYLDIVTEETHRLERIIGDLLDLARLEGGGTGLRRDTVEVSALFDRVAARHERESRERAIRLTSEVASDAATVVGDRDRLEQALQNLAANALRHTPDGGEITLSSAREADGLHFVVRDTGPGIPPEHLDLIFDRFYKVDASRRAAGGSGLGLSIVKAIVERHGGAIVARNEGGAVFEIVLPDRSNA
jgi:signal transduction histidine kinase